MTVINANSNFGGIGVAGNRIHVNRAAHWTRSAGSDFWYSDVAAGIAADDLITDYGWTTTALSYSSTGGGDLLSAADTGSPRITIVETANDLLLSPVLFGDYSHSQIAATILGYAPTTLCLEAYAAFTTASAAETIGGFGFSTGSSLTATNQVAFIHSNGANFAIRSTPGTTTFIDTGAAVDNAYHLWKIVLTAGSTGEWFIDGVSQGTITLVTDLYPTAFSMSGTTTNEVGLAWAHIWYQ